MKKILLLTCGILMTASVAQACAGITVKGTSGYSYCMSKFTMNWYSAYAWCKDQGKNLIVLDEVCNTTSIGTCSELKLSDAEKENITKNGAKLDWVWTATSVDTSKAFRVTLASGIISNSANFYGRNDAHFALCK